jgi:cell division protein FtsL
MYTLKNIIQKISEYKKILIILLGVVATILVSFWILQPKTYTLTIEASPEGSLISVNNQYTSHTKFVKKLSKGSYKISVSKDGY